MLRKGAVERKTLKIQERRTEGWTAPLKNKRGWCPGQLEPERKVEKDRDRC